MNKLITTGILFFISNMLFSQITMRPYVNDLEKFNLTEKVKKVTEINLDTTGGEVIETIASTLEMNEAGMLMVEHGIFETDSFFYKNNRLDKVVMYYLGILSGIKYYFYLDQKNTLIIDSLSRLNELYESERISQVFDDKHRLVQTTRTRADVLGGLPYFTATYVYNDEMRTVDEIKYDYLSHHDTLFIKHFFDPSGLLVLKETIVSKNQNGRYEHEVEFTYDKYGNLVKVIVPEGKKKSTINFWYKYDSNGNKINYFKKDDYRQGLLRSFVYQYEFY